MFVATAGSGGCGAEPPKTFIEPDRFPNAYAQALCTSLRHCCEENAVTYNYDLCAAGWKTSIQTRFFGAGQVNYDQKAATNCVETVRIAETKPCVPTKGSVSER